jgi:hypothetical protein
MKEIIQQHASRLSQLLTHVKMKSILPFKEKPSVDLNSSASENKDKKSTLNASELFSFFTADIIKEEITFTR